MQDKFPNLKGTIFIVTYGRSGSTLLQSLLQSIPGAHITGENHNLMETLFMASERARKTRQTWGKDLLPKDHPWYGADEITPVRFERRLVQNFVDEILHPPQDARWFGFKEIRYSALGDRFEAFLNFYQRNFPNPFFVFNSRNAEEVAKSAWWVDWPTEEVLEMVRSMDRRFAEFATANPSVSHHVFYEETVRDPATLKPLFDKLGEPFDPTAAQAKLATRLTH